MANIASVHAIEILDSRGYPTVRTALTTDSGAVYVASVPSGASTGSYEAHELRDGDNTRYSGRGVLSAVKNVNTTINQALQNYPLNDPRAIDALLLKLDGSDSKANLGANALLSVSMAAHKAEAGELHIPLWQFLKEYYFPETQPAFPRLMVNIVNGGKHANWQFTIQEFLIMPNDTLPSRSIMVAAAIFHTLGTMLKEQGLSTLVGDEGGYSPSLSDNDEVFQIITHAAAKAGYVITEHFSLGIDAAASEWYKEGKYYFRNKHVEYTPQQLLSYYLHMYDAYHIASFEDAFAEDDWESFAAFTKTSKGYQVVGDDLYVTNVERLKKGIEMGATNAILIKPNQIGTISETVDAIKMARNAGMHICISHRSGETEDTFIADLSYACAADFLKAGSISRSERLAKYNRLLEIEQKL